MNRSLCQERTSEALGSPGTPPLHSEAEASSIMGCYMQDVRCFSLLSRERETILARQIREGSHQWRGALLHHLMHLPVILDREAHLRCGALPISEIWTADHAPSETEMVAALDHLQRLCAQMHEFVQRPSLHRADTAATPTVTALRADMRALVQPWSWQSAFLQQVWTEFDQAMAAASISRRCQPVARFTAPLGYRMDDLHPLWQHLQGLHAQVEAAKQEMITRNLRLVIRVVHDFRSTHVPFVDLIQEGNIGLMRAVEKFDDRRGLKFSTYAVWWIKQAIRRAVLTQSTLIRIPEYLRDSAAQVHRAQEYLTAALGMAPTAQDIAEHLGIPRERVRRSLGLAPDPISLDQPREEGRTASLYPLLPDTQAMSSQEWLEQQDLREHLQRALDRLTPRETEIIRRRFGLHGQPAETLRQIALDLQLSHERVRQLESHALAKLAQEGAVLRDYMSA